MTDYEQGKRDGSLAAALGLCNADGWLRTDYERGWADGYKETRLRIAKENRLKRERSERG